MICIAGNNLAMIEWLLDIGVTATVGHGLGTMLHLYRPIGIYPHLQLVFEAAWQVGCPRALAIG
jgi:hypothetical protein